LLASISSSANDDVPFNHLHPPFDNVKMRQAVADQREFMTAVAGDPENWSICNSFSPAPRWPMRSVRKR
jgi:hypothetical protein